MKRQDRPFVVEFKKDRRDAKRVQRSIWGNVDLVAAAASVMDIDVETTGHTDQPASGIGPSSQSSQSHETKSPPRILPTLPAHEQVDEPERSHLEPVRVDSADSPVPPSEQQASRPAKRLRRTRRNRSRQSEDEALPVGQRWKKRLPKIIR